MLCSKSIILDSRIIKSYNFEYWIIVNNVYLKYIHDHLIPTSLSKHNDKLDEEMCNYDLYLGSGIRQS
jgi:hypothetical protein